MSDSAPFHMKDLVAPVLVGTTGFLGTVEVSRMSTWLGTIIALVTIMSMLPIAISRWKKLLKGETMETRNPFPDTKK